MTRDSRMKERYKSFKKGDKVVIEVERYGDLTKEYGIFQMIDGEFIVLKMDYNAGIRLNTFKHDGDIVTINHFKR